MAPVRIVGLSGSLTVRPSSLVALKMALAAAERAGASTDLFDIRQLQLPWYDPAATPPEAAVRFAEAVWRCDGMIWATPLYHGSMSGVIKNAIDWLELLGDRDPPYLGGKPVGLIATAGGTQGLQAINSMELAVRALRGYTVPLVAPISQAWKAFEAGETRDPKITEQLRLLGEEVVRVARAFAARQVRPRETLEGAELDSGS